MYRYYSKRSVDYPEEERRKFEERQMKEAGKEARSMIKHLRDTNYSYDGATVIGADDCGYKELGTAMELRALMHRDEPTFRAMVRQDLEHKLGERDCTIKELQKERDELRGAKKKL